MLVESKSKKEEWTRKIEEWAVIKLTCKRFDIQMLGCSLEDPTPIQCNMCLTWAVWRNGIDALYQRYPSLNPPSVKPLKKRHSHLKQFFDLPKAFVEVHQTLFPKYKGAFFIRMGMTVLRVGL